MPTTKITAHMVVKNEDIFIWYAIASIIDYVSKIIIYDTGSTDNTVVIIKSFKSRKIEFEEKDNVDEKELINLRQEQIDKTKTDWFWIIDGDEIYPQSTVKEVAGYINNNSSIYEGGVVRRYDLLGDIYHYQSEEVGEYNLFGLRGHLVLRLINKSLLPGLYVKGIYPNEGYYSNDRKPLIDRSPKKFFITQNRFSHAMYLKRSTLGGNLINTLHRRKIKQEVGIPFSYITEFPEVFFQKRPAIVPDVIMPRDLKYNFIAAIVTPFKKLKRIIFKLLT